MPRTATIIAAAAGLAVLGAAAWYGQRAAGRWVYEGVQIGTAFAEARRQHATDPPPAG